MAVPTSDTSTQEVGVGEYKFKVILGYLVRWRAAFKRQERKVEKRKRKKGEGKGKRKEKRDEGKRREEEEEAKEEEEG